MNEVTIIAENSVGTLATIAEALGGVGINIEAISAYESDKNAVFRVVTKDVTSARKTLEKIKGIKNIIVSDIIVVEMTNRPGELGKITRKFANKGIDLESVYIINKRSETTDVALKPRDEQYSKALEIIKKH
ncbi:ACT domain-containing protein [Candidatus Micrarchaeota archaeon]|nr:ACT domain-containing protein [Candidatus Micrarchaeota archaeon]